MDHLSLIRLASLICLAFGVMCINWLGKGNRISYTSKRELLTCKIVTGMYDSSHSLLMVLCLNFTLRSPKIILITVLHDLQGSSISSWGRHSVLDFPVASSNRTEWEPLAIFLNKEGIGANSVTVSSFWTLPVYKRGIPKRKKQLLDQWRKWKGSLHSPGVCGSHWFVWFKAVWNAARQGFTSASHVPAGNKPGPSVS